MPSSTITLPPGFAPVGAAEAADPAARRALFRASSSTPVRHDGKVGVFDPAGCDLSVLNSGRAPLLLDHSRSVRDVVGVVESAWVEGEAILAVARFGEGGDADLAWQNVRAGAWGNCSLGNMITHVEKEGSAFVIKGWVATELSLVPQGWVADAAAVPCWDLEELHRRSVKGRAAFMRAQEARMWRARAEGEDARRAHLHCVATFVAADLGMDEADVRGAMDRFLAAVTPGEGSA
jgi:hypothetical protein